MDSKELFIDHCFSLRFIVNNALSNNFLTYYYRPCPNPMDQSPLFRRKINIISQQDDILNIDAFMWFSLLVIQSFSLANNLMRMV